ncbi:MAG TPA: hypothetical protein VK121_02515 [Pseudogracilibacillus sp.]|nr:hypothetical protein [Pseudogracilibacillus sp.]
MLQIREQMEVITKLIEQMSFGIEYVDDQLNESNPDEAIDR